VFLLELESVDISEGRKDFFDVIFRETEVDIANIETMNGDLFRGSRTTAYISKDFLLMVDTQQFGRAGLDDSFPLQ
jgi:hypothetical protein